jgi:hypothetical protein
MQSAAVMSKLTKYVCYLPVYGCIATGVIYLGIGVIAILSFLMVKDGGADETSLLAFLNDYTLGKILVWSIAFGTLSYVVWRIYETLRDPYDYGSDLTGLARRSGIALSSIADALLCYSAIQILLGSGSANTDGQPHEYRAMAEQIIQEENAAWLIVAGGIIILITAVVQLVYGITRGYGERLDIGHFSIRLKKAIHYLAIAGYSSRGLILGIIGFFLLKGGITKNSRHIVNTDKAFDFIGDHVGGLPFIVVALGTICYGLFMFSLAWTYDTDAD